MFARTKKLPAVSVIIPVFKGQDYVATAIDSVLSQGYPHIEVLVVPDDGETYRFLRGTCRSTRVRLLGPSAKQMGAGGARNRGIDHAVGDFIALCDADDMWPSGYLASLMPTAQKEGAVFGTSRYTNWAGETVRETQLPPAMLSIIGYGQLLASLRPVVHRSMEVGYHDIFAEDVLHDLHLIAEMGGQVSIVDAVAYQIRQRVGSMTNSGQDVETRIQANYTWIENVCAHRPTRLGLQRLSRQDRADVATAFRFRRFVSERFAQSGTQNYNAFTANDEATLWDEYLAACETGTNVAKAMTTSGDKA